jgi:hypothetical protein
VEGAREGKVVRETWAIVVIVNFRDPSHSTVIVVLKKRKSAKSCRNCNEIAANTKYFDSNCPSDRTRISMSGHLHENLLLLTLNVFFTTLKFNCNF